MAGVAGGKQRTRREGAHCAARPPAYTASTTVCAEDSRYVRWRLEGHVRRRSGGRFGAGALPHQRGTPLVASLIHGHSDIARYLLEHGADPQLRSDFDDMTPLEAARRHQRTELVALLQARGAQEERKPFWWRWLPV
ncbi:ankyrin repeat domain-containing protein [Acidovorax sp. 28-64-14]|uniref:ankyrin repeat domain-containing protein n=1 Tax=Acidovorax sp. 28-64-14 TaxID=1970310 RepID=UPI0025C2E2FF|nr:ankyrin repeat domain-containing protein [Acidovorax sp. 28-64-14]